MNLKNKIPQALITTAQSVVGMIVIFSLIGCNHSNKTITAFRDSGMPMAEHWAVESVVSGGSLILKRRFQKRTLQLCGLDNW